MPSFEEKKDEVKGEWVLDEKEFPRDLDFEEKFGKVETVRVLDRYKDFKCCGSSGWYNPETGESGSLGKMVTETVKYVDLKDNKIKLGHTLEQKLPEDPDYEDVK